MLGRDRRYGPQFGLRPDRSAPDSAALFAQCAYCSPARMAAPRRSADAADLRYAFSHLRRHCAGRHVRVRADGAFGTSAKAFGGGRSRRDVGDARRGRLWLDGCLGQAAGTVLIRPVMESGASPFAMMTWRAAIGAAALWGFFLRTRDGGPDGGTLVDTGGDRRDLVVDDACRHSADAVAAHRAPGLATSPDRCTAGRRGCFRAVRIAADT